jgi:hypothetical protein
METIHFVRITGSGISFAATVDTMRFDTGGAR